ncbi:hypothetical protein LLH23_16700 [bacterium]|nr:hypothetical protein [bacterium]
MIRYQPPPVEGAPPYVVWTIGIGLIIVAVLVVACLVSIALWLRDEARYHGRSPWLWFALGLVGGWVTALVWLVVREYDERGFTWPSWLQALRRRGRDAPPPETDG